MFTTLTKTFVNKINQVTKWKLHLVPLSQNSVVILGRKVALKFLNQQDSLEI